MSQVDQTRFMTDEVALVVEGQLTLASDARVVEGNSFQLKLVVPISYGDTVEEGSLTLIVERIKGTAFVHANDDRIYSTWARVVPDGEAFRITVEVPEEGTNVLGATVYVAEDMERVILEHIAQQDCTS